MVKKYYVYLFRHGQTYFNKKGIFTGWMDSKLTSKGIIQAKLIAKKLKNKKFGIAIQTRLGRSKKTLKEVLKYHPECKKIIIDDRMIERNYGKLNGISHSEFIKRIGKKEFNLLKEGDAIENFDKNNRMKIEKFLGEEEYKLIHRGYDIPPLGGESFANVEERVKDFIKDLKKLIKKEKTNIVISAHGNSIRIFRRIMEKKSKDVAVKWNIPYSKVFVYSVYV